MCTETDSPWQLSTRVARRADKNAEVDWLIFATQVGPISTRLNLALEEELGSRCHAVDGGIYGRIPTDSAIGSWLSLGVDNGTDCDSCVQCAPDGLHIGKTKVFM